jgi:triosephosphate isomerase
MSQRVMRVVANWKMNGSAASNQVLVQAVTAGLLVKGKSKVALCVPHPYLAQVRALLGEAPVALGAQDMSEFAPGAYTGDVSLEMLQDLGCSLTLAGHSERRHYYGETSERAAAKALRAMRGGMCAVLCVGERLDEHDAGRTSEVVLGQLRALLDQLKPEDDLERLVVAYEPVWAIGTGKTASPEQAQDVHDMLRQAIEKACGQRAASVPLLYGGSVRPENASALFAMPDIDGGLIGGASLVARDFLQIVAAASAAMAG